MRHVIDSCPSTLSHTFSNGVFSRHTHAYTHAHFGPAFVQGGAIKGAFVVLDRWQHIFNEAMYTVSTCPYVHTAPAYFERAVASPPLVDD